MPTRKNSSPLMGKRVHLRPPRRSDEKAFIAQARASRSCMAAGCRRRRPRRVRRVRRALQHGDAPTPRHAGFLVVRNDDDALAGVFNFSEIVRGAFHSAYVGYYAFAPLAGDGYMAEGFALALEFAFGQLKLHRVEANVQPANRRSLALVERARDSSAKAIRAAT